ARLAARRATSTDLDLLSKSLDGFEGETQGEYSEERDFHLLILRVSKNESLASRGRDIHGQLRLVRSQSGSPAERAQRAYGEHVSIFEAIRSRDEEAAARSVHSHLTNSLLHSAELIPTVSRQANALRPLVIPEPKDHWDSRAKDG